MSGFGFRLRYHYTSPTTEISCGENNRGSGTSTICDLGFGALTALTGVVSDEQALSFVNSIVSTVSNSNGSYIIEKCPLSVKQQVNVFSDVGNSIEIMRRVKKQYDPQNTLNPGRFVGKI